MRLNALAFSALLLTSSAAHADSYYDYKDGKRYLCTLDDGGIPSCHDQAGKTECTEWSFYGMVKVGNTYYMCPSDKACMIQKGYSRTCRVYDGCGQLTNSFGDQKTESTGYMEPCTPC